MVIVGVVMLLGGVVYPNAVTMELGEPLGHFDQANVTIKMGVGQLTMDSSAKDLLLTGKLRYDTRLGRPVLEQRSNGNQATLVLSQPEGRLRLPTFGRVESKWNVSLNKDVPLKLDVTTGVGESRLNLGDLMLRELTVTAGVGDTTIQLPATEQDQYVRLRGGVGEVAIYLPRNMNIQVETRSGIGSVKAPRLERTANGYVRNVGGESTLYLNIQMGVGSVELII